MVTKFNFAAVVLGAFLMTLGVPSYAQDGTRSVSGPERGKCIFSTKVMPKNDFSHSAYKKVKSLFSPGEPIAVRCFYENGEQSNYRSLGSVANSLRDSGKYYAELEWTNENSRSSFSDFRIKAVNHNYNGSWDQQRYDLTSDYAECDFKLRGRDKSKYRAKADGCMDFAGFVQSRDISDPGQQEFCVRIFMKFANSKQWRTVGNEERLEPVYVEKTMSRGCFKVDLGGAKLSLDGPSGAPTSSVPPADGTVLANLDKACKNMPYGNGGVCKCMRKEAEAKGLAYMSPGAANLWITSSFNPGAFTQGERRAAYDAASADDRAAAADSSMAEIGGHFLATCVNAQTMRRPF